MTTWLRQCLRAEDGVLSKLTSYRGHADGQPRGVKLNKQVTRCAAEQQGLWRRTEQGRRTEKVSACALFGRQWLGKALRIRQDVKSPTEASEPSEK